MTPTTEAGRALYGDGAPWAGGQPLSSTLLAAILAIEAEAVTLTLEACQEHLGCACGDIKGHLATRGLIFKKVTA